VTRTRPLHLALSFVAATVLTACTSTSATTTTPGTGGTVAPASSSPGGGASPSATGSMIGHPMQHNDQDITFAAAMIDHHRQALQIAKLAPGRTTNPTILALARSIAAAQAPEITTMSNWLTMWSQPIPEDMSGMDMGGSMPGMLGQADITKLTKARGAAFDRLFLTLMTSHHRGAITMAKTQVTSGCMRVISAVWSVITRMHNIH
jgi:uncharacterized protein (DUF305 family)